ncbi:hypothetical protein JXM67_12550 [candidate division WOR-3 bacterium]|nr:hypothetical protein [candidate division WOR-3 bacterium]
MAIDYTNLEIEGWGHTKDSFSLVIQAAARLLGIKLDYRTVYAMSSNCFAPVLNPEESCTAWWNMVAGGALELVGARFGLSFNKLDIDIPVDAKELEGRQSEILAETAKKVRQTLDNDEVVITAGGWKFFPPDSGKFAPWCFWGIITSVEPDGTILGATLNKKKNHPIEWPYPMWAVFKTEPAITEREADIRMLRRGIARIYGTEEPLLGEKHVSGLGAMDMWIKQLDRIPYCPACGERSWSCAVSTVQPVYFGAKNITDYLEAREDDYSASEQALLETITKHYKKIASTLEPYAIKQDDGHWLYEDIVGDAAKQKEHTEVITQVRNEMAAAAEDMEKAIKGIKNP